MLSWVEMRKKFRNLIVLFVLITAMFGLFGCAEIGNNNSYTKITATEGMEMMQTEEKVVILDVREKDEYEAEHIEDSVLLPLGQIETDAAQTLPDKDAAIIVYCRSGVRSAEAAGKLAKLGYKNVYDMGGIIDWKNKGYKVV